MPMTVDKPFQLLPSFRERVWGRRSLEPFFADATHGEPIGEAWFTASDNQTSLGLPLGPLMERFPAMLGSACDPRYPGICPLLVKFLFTSSRLSVQVHPDDEYAATHHNSLGKTEAWYVLDVQPPGEVAIGFREPIDPDRLRDSAHSGEIEDLLEWRKVEAGDLVFVPAGTVHAIGAGLTVCEIQQNSDITYRLYDYGRPRELHLEHGCKVSKLIRHEHASAPITLAPWREHLVDCEYFRIEKLYAKASIHFANSLPHYVLLMCIAGSGAIADVPFVAGQVWMVPAGGEGFTVEGTGSEWVLAYAAESALDGIRSEE